MSSVEDVLANVAAHAAIANDLASFRAAVLAEIRVIVSFDKAIFHALSPRVPASTAALIGIDPATLATSMSGWDAVAVDLGRLRELANERLVATDLDAFPPRSRGRARFHQHVTKPLGARSMVVVHLIVGGRAWSAIVLLARREGAFDEHVVARLRRVAPAIAVADALVQIESASPRATAPVRLVCRDGRLTDRQREIVEHVALGHTNEECARALGISPNTLRNQLAAVFRTLGAANRADVVRLAVLTPAE